MGLAAHSHDKSPSSPVLCAPTFDRPGTLHSQSVSHWRNMTPKEDAGTMVAVWPAVTLGGVSNYYQGSHCLLEICINRRETLRILHQWHKKCVQENLKLMHIQSQNDGVTCRRQCWQTQFSSTAEFSNEMKLKSRLPPFSLTRSRVLTRILFSVSTFIVF